MLNELFGFVVFYGVLAGLALAGSIFFARVEDPDWRPQGRDRPRRYRDAAARGARVVRPRLDLVPIGPGGVRRPAHTTHVVRSRGGLVAPRLRSC